MAEVDRRRVERILRNLLVNAVEHGEGRDVVVTVAADRDAVAVAVRDHGVGLAPGEEQLVFERFWRADPARARTIGGHRPRPGHRPRGRPAARRLAAGVGREGPRLGLPAHPAADRRAAAGRLAAAARPRRGGGHHQRRHHAGGGPGRGRRADDPVTRVAADEDGSAWLGAGARPAADEVTAGAGGACRALVAALSTAGCVSMPTGGPVQSYPVTQGPDAQSQPYVQIQPQPPRRRLVAEADRPGVPHRLRQLRHLRPGGPAVPDAAGAEGLERPDLVGGRLQERPERRGPGLPGRGEAAKTAKTARPRSNADRRRRATCRSPAPSRRPCTGNGSYSVPSTSAAGSASDAPPPFQLVKDAGGQWRISSAPPEVLLTSDSFAERLPAPQPVLLRSDGQLPGPRPDLRAAARPGRPDERAGARPDHAAEGLAVRRGDEDRAPGGHQDQRRHGGRRDRRRQPHRLHRQGDGDTRSCSRSRRSCSGRCPAPGRAGQPGRRCSRSRSS